MCELGSAGADQLHAQQGGEDSQEGAQRKAQADLVVEHQEQGEGAEGDSPRGSSVVIQERKKQEEGQARKA